MKKCYEVYVEEDLIGEVEVEDEPSEGSGWFDMDPTQI